MSDSPRTLRPDLGFRRIAVVLSGGGAQGAYAVGVLKTLEAAGLKPSILAGVSVGAISAVAWLAGGFRVTALARVWSRLTASGIGLRWVTLMLRIVGVFVALFAATQILVTLAGSPQLGLPQISRRVSGDEIGVVLDVLAWVAVGVLGWSAARWSRETEEWLQRLTPQPSDRTHVWLGVALWGGIALQLGVWIAGVPWPHRFHATVLVVLGAAWLAHRPGELGDRVRRMLLRLLPETQGRGLWRGGARRRILERLVQQGEPGRLLDPDVHLILASVALDSAHVVHFVNWEPDEEFRRMIERGLGEVRVCRTPGEIVRAAVASSAIPVVFEPIQIDGREFVDAGGFSNQPLHAVIADRADAALVVLVSPRQGPRGAEHGFQVVELIGRLLELVNWRDLQRELADLPAQWSREEVPSRLCVVEPESLLPGGLLKFDPATARELMRHGERDAWSALERAGWLAGTPAIQERASSGTASSSAASPGRAT
jgi:predicted acylesterase/phospholipase RssA